MIPKKKPFGLAKKVPASFEDLPDIEDLKNKREASFRNSQTPGSAQWGNNLLLFEVTPCRLKVLWVRCDGKNVAIVKVKSYGIQDPEGEKKTPLSGVEQALEECLSDFKIPLKTEVRMIIRTEHVFLGKTEKPLGPKNQMRDAVIWQLSEKASFPF